MWTIEPDLISRKIKYKVPDFYRQISDREFHLVVLAVGYIHG